MVKVEGPLEGEGDVSKGTAGGMVRGRGAEFRG